MTLKYKCTGCLHLLRSILILFLFIFIYLSLLYKFEEKIYK